MAEKTYSQLVMELSEIRDRKPRTLHQMFGSRATVEQEAIHDGMIKAWRNEYARKKRELKKAAQNEQ